MVRIISVCSIMMLFGCSSVIVDKELDILKDSSEEIKEDISSIKYTSQEQVFIDHAFSIIDKYSNPDVTHEDIINDLKVLRSNYKNIKTIIINNFDKYPLDIKERFIEYDKSVLFLDKEIKQAIEEENTMSSVRLIVGYSMSIIKILVAIK